MAKGTRTTGAAARRLTGAVSKAAKAVATPARTAAKKVGGSAPKAGRAGSVSAAAAKRTVKPAKAAPKRGAKAVAKSAAKATKTVKAKSTKAKAPVKSPAKAPAKRPAAKKAPVKAPAKKGAAKKAPAAKAKAAAAKGAAKKGPAKAKAAAVAKGTARKKAAVKPALAPKPAPSRPVLSEVVARKHRTPAVAASTMERLRAVLLEELGHHERQAEDLLAEAEALASEREPGDTQFDEESGEGDTLSIERERDLALSTAARQTVEEIEKALARMDNGLYGYCEVCGDRIPVPRLEAIPWADQCVKCKSRGERRR
jgi:RNA polymerase-binding transcription factor